MMRRPFGADGVPSRIMDMSRSCLRSASALALAFAAVTLGACASMGPPQLTLKITGVEAVAAAPPEQRLKVSLRIVNRADRDVAIDGITYALDINGREFASGVFTQKVTVPGYGETTVAIPVAGTPSAMAPTADDAPPRTSASGGAAVLSTYRMRGKANANFSGATFDTQAELPVPAPARPAG